MGKGATVVIRSQPDCHVCPEIKLWEYLLIRNPLQGNFFGHFDGTHLSRYQFNAVLKKSLAYLHLPAQGYKKHSFRIGMATASNEEGRSVEEIKRMGRWKSCALEGYIRSY